MWSNSSISTFAIWVTIGVSITLCVKARIPLESSWTKSWDYKSITDKIVPALSIDNLFKSSASQSSLSLLMLYSSARTSSSDKSSVSESCKSLKSLKKHSQITIYHLHIFYKHATQHWPVLIAAMLFRAVHFWLQRWFGNPK